MSDERVCVVKLTDAHGVEHKVKSAGGISPFPKTNYLWSEVVNRSPVSSGLGLFASVMMVRSGIF
jgi:hypothetical protein